MSMTSEDMQQAIEAYCEGEIIEAAEFPNWGYDHCPYMELRFKSGKLLVIEFTLSSSPRAILPVGNVSIGTWTGNQQTGIRKRLLDAHKQLIDKENDRYEFGDEYADAHYPKDPPDPDLLATGKPLTPSPPRDTMPP